ncbi:MAG TPA: carboxypeptidase regulatory-like domain-containing protein [Anaeromyxobacter sp.]|nr:carboxypeptidase regulatory-like domain-containing protein [Anaeromyxobacter sp.]
MIQEADERVGGWLGQVAGAPVWRERPRDHAKEKGVGLYLLELGEQPPARDGRKPPLQIQLRYLVTTWAETVEEEHRLLGVLVFAALERTDWEVVLRAVPVETWAALGVPPRPSFLLHVPLRVERPTHVAPRVLAPLVTRTVAAVPLDGRVVGPRNLPIARARVELPSLSAATETDWEGRFLFPRVPAEPRAKRIRVVAKGIAQEFTHDVPPDGGGPVIIKLELQEA